MGRKECGDLCLPEDVRACFMVGCSRTMTASLRRPGLSFSVRFFVGPVAFTASAVQAVAL